jgi:serine/threonine-protein kinase HipA
MTNMPKFKCHICYGEVEPENYYHQSCLKKLFNTKEAPVIEFSNNNIASMALEYIKEKHGLPGVQKKLSLTIEHPKKSKPRLTLIGYLGGEYILKPPTNEYPFMPEIEDLTMHLADIANIIVSEHGLVKMADKKIAYITKRFDRKGNNKLAVEDLCQLSLKLTENKYRSSHEQVGKIIRRYSKVPGDDTLRYFELVLFSFIVGNADMHLKNFSMVTNDLNNIRLSPCYDLLSTKLLIASTIDPEELALPINGKKSNIIKKDFVKLGENLNIPIKVINYSISKMLSNQDKWFNKIDDSFVSEELKEKFKILISNNCQKLA